MPTEEEEKLRLRLRRAVRGAAKYRRRAHVAERIITGMTGKGNPGVVIREVSRELFKEQKKGVEARRTLEHVIAELLNTIKSLGGRP